MTNLVPSNITVPAHLASRVGTSSALGAAVVGGLSPSASYPRISIKGSRFRIVEGDIETVLDSTTLNVVIVGANPRISKTWFAKQWDANAEPSGPDCFSLDGIAPDPSAESPQSDLCANCPHNAWGSKITPSGQKAKACADNKRLAVVAADDPSGPIYLLTVTPAALKGLSQYQRELTMRGIPLEVVKTKVSFDTDASFPKLTFAFGGFLTAEVQEVVDKLFGSDEVKEITGEAQISSSASVPKIAQAPVEKATSVSVTVEEPAAATPKRGLGATKATPASSVPPAPAAAPKRGFGAAKTALADTPATAPAPAPAPAAAPAPANNAAASLADEIAALIGEVDADDA